MTKTVEQIDAEVLWNAADLLRTKGWCQHIREDDEGRYCLAGAIEASVQRRRIWSSWQRSAASEEVCRIQRRVTHTIDGAWLTEWNDRDGRKADEVITVLEKTAIKLEEEGR